MMEQVLSTTMYVLYTEKATILISLLFVDRKSVNLVSDRVFSRDAVSLSLDLLFLGGEPPPPP